MFGPSRWLDRPGVVLEGQAPPAAAPVIAAAWEANVLRLSHRLGWPKPTCAVVEESGHFVLAFTAPGDRLLTATEVNEWAWQAAARSAGFGDDPPFLSPGDLSREESAAISQLAVLAAMEIRAPTSELAHRAPRDMRVALVSGSNGKTTTTRLIAAMTTAHGWRTGWSCTDGVFIAGEAVEAGDWSGPAGGQRVIAEPSIEAAVLETARGGILRRGLGVLGADVAVITNIEADHFGEYGVRSLADLAQVKLVTAKGLRPGGVLVLNGDDPSLTKAELPADLPVRWFATAGRTGAVQPIDAWCEAGHLWLDDGTTQHDLGAIEAMPLTASGTASYNITNALAASLAASQLGVPADIIATGLARFGSQPGDNPGRMTRFEFDGITVLVDYAHNPTGLAGLLKVAKKVPHQRMLLLLGQAGNRGDDALAELAAVAWSAKPDRIVLKELDGYLRGREVGEVPAFLAAELQRRGTPVSALVIVLDEVDAVREALRWAEPGDVLVLPVHDLAARREVLALLEARVDARNR